MRYEYLDVENIVMPIKHLISDASGCKRKVVKLMWSYFNHHGAQSVKWSRIETLLLWNVRHFLFAEGYDMSNSVTPAE